jgi:outer membrane protein assembly factor BamD (BamD/ComL family)
MSTTGITSSMLSQVQQFQKDFQQLGADLTSGNLSAAQSDFATLQKDIPQAGATSTTQSSSPIAQAFSQLSKDLQSGNLSGAQQDYSNIQQDFQNQAAQMHGHHRHHHGSGGGENSQVSQLFGQLGQDLQSGNLTSAQSNFSSLQQLLQNNSTAGSGSGSTYAGVSVNA